MTYKILHAVLAGAILATSAPVLAEGPTAAAAVKKPPAQVTIPNSRRVAFISKVNGHRYSIDIGLPDGPAPDKGYGVLYVLDGDAYFGTAVEAARVNGNTAGVVVVGVGYPDDPAFIKQTLARHAPVPAEVAKAPPFDAAVTLERMYDMTLPASDAQLADQSVAGMMTPKAKDVGGMDDFLKTIETEIKPRVAKLAKIDPTNQALFGHSLGGLAVLHALFTEPNAFRTFIVASPSIWWNDKAVLKNEAAFTAQVNAGSMHPRILITVGSEEQDVPKLPPSMEAVKDQVMKLIGKSRMVDNVRELSARLTALHGTAPYEVGEVAVFAHQNHGISPFPALARGIAFAFPAE